MMLRLSILFSAFAAIGAFQVQNGPAVVRAKSATSMGAFSSSSPLMMPDEVGSSSVCIVLFILSFKQFRCLMHMNVIDFN